jgi:TPR repeat protein
MAAHDVASIIYTALGCGVTRSKRRAMQWMRKAAENGSTETCYRIALHMYTDLPYAREVGLVAEAAGVATSAGVIEGHDVPPQVMTSVLHWLRKSGYDPVGHLEGFRYLLLE